MSSMPSMTFVFCSCPATYFLCSRCSARAAMGTRFTSRPSHERWATRPSVALNNSGQPVPSSRDISHFGHQPLNLDQVCRESVTNPSLGVTSGTFLTACATNMCNRRATARSGFRGRISGSSFVGRTVGALFSSRVGNAHPDPAGTQRSMSRLGGKKTGASRVVRMARRKSNPLIAYPQRRQASSCLPRFLLRHGIHGGSSRNAEHFFDELPLLHSASASFWFTRLNSDRPAETFFEARFEVGPLESVILGAVTLDLDCTHQ